MSKNRILVVAAHPDDEVLGCGATMARHARAGDDVVALILGQGIASRGGDTKAVQREIQALHRDAKAAAKTLGLAEIILMDLPDNAFDSIPLLTIVHAIEDVKRRIRPEIVYTHHHGDLNIDHRLTQEAVLAAFRPQPGERCRELYAFEVPSATGWNAETAANAFLPTHFVDATATLKHKMKAMQAYRSEIRAWPHPRSANGIDALARVRGMTVGLAAAEAFMPLRRIVS